MQNETIRAAKVAAKNIQRAGDKARHQEQAQAQARVLAAKARASKRLTKPTGVILWEGASPMDGGPIVAVMTFDSTNRKTGPMCQVWILRQDLHPVDAVKTGWDESICGHCPYRLGPDGRICYVEVGKAPASVWRAYRRGRYPTLQAYGALAVAKRINNRPIRWGSYGDPAMIPSTVVAVVQALTAGGHTGYTHQWREPFAAWARTMFMASVGSFSEWNEADSKGWKTFLVSPVGTRSEMGKQCPATVEGSAAQCHSCKQCDASKGSIWVEAHGQGAALV